MSLLPGLTEKLQSVMSWCTCRFWIFWKYFCSSSVVLKVEFKLFCTGFCFWFSEVAKFSFSFPLDKSLIFLWKGDLVGLWKFGEQTSKTKPSNYSIFGWFRRPGFDPRAGLWRLGGVLAIFDDVSGQIFRQPNFRGGFSGLFWRWAVRLRGEVDFSARDINRSHIRLGRLFS